MFEAAPPIADSARAVTPAPPSVRLCLGFTGHRQAHPGFTANRIGIAASLDSILEAVDIAVASAPAVPGSGAVAHTRLHTLLADGADLLMAEMAVAREYELVCPLPFGRRLNAAINAAPVDAADARALIAGRTAADPATERRAMAIRAAADQAHVFELADRDDAIGADFVASLDASDVGDTVLFAAEASRRVALAGRILIEQSDIVIAVWDGVSTAHIGGTGDTIAAALRCGGTVICIDPANPEAWRILHTPESLNAPAVEEQTTRAETIAALVRAVLSPIDAASPAPARGRSGMQALAAEQWRAGSKRLWHGYRRIEALFGGDAGSPLRSLRSTYEPMAEIAQGSAAAMMAELRGLPGTDPGLPDRIEQSVLRRFAWADGISSHLSDSYRGGMIINFVLSAFAIVGGIAYLPLAPDNKWPFALFEFALLVSIIAITAMGQRRRWHRRWFETRRVAEYLRHSPLLLTLGVARPPGRWPRGATTSWPEWYARQALREVGLPHIAVTSAYLHAALTGLLENHVVQQRDYHVAKARRLTTVHHRLDRLSERAFKLALLSVAIYLALAAMAAFRLIPHETVAGLSKTFTLLGVLFPTLGGAIAGIRFFGDFERFAAISAVTGQKLDGVMTRIEALKTMPADALDYALVSELAHAADDIVVSEIENWQAVFRGKQITVPV